MACGCGKKKRPAAQPRGFAASGNEQQTKLSSGPALWNGTAEDDEPPATDEKT